MSDNVETLRRKIDKARSLGSVVRTMKTIAALNIRQYEAAVRSLEAYSHTVELGLSACLRRSGVFTGGASGQQRRDLPVIAVVFGSDQGLVGQFNDRLAETVKTGIPTLQAPLEILSVGDRIEMRLSDAGIVSRKRFTVPGSVKAITPLIGELLSAIEGLRVREQLFELQLYYNCPLSGGSYRQVSKRLLPLDMNWERELIERAGPWPTASIPDLPNGIETTRWALIREYLFVSLFRACAESLAAENASRLAAMQRAKNNIDDLLEKLSGSFNELRQARIDEELFDVVSGFQALEKAKKQHDRKPENPVRRNG